MLFVINAGRIARADDLTLYFFPSRGISWKSPSTLLASVAKNFVLGDEYLIGHVTVELKCESSGKRIHTGMTFGDFSQTKDLILKDGSGVSVLLTPMKGQLERPVYIERYLREDADAGRLSFMRYLISPSTCERLAQYYEEYKERNLGAHYGLSLRPRYGEGAGCSAFAMSFLELGGLVDSEFNSFVERQVLVPESWMGVPLRNKKVSAYDLWQHANRWASTHEPHVKLNFWDPDLMHVYVHTKIAEVRRGGEKNMQIQRWSNSWGIVQDKRDVATPTDPIWLY